MFGADPAKDREQRAKRLEKLHAKFPNQAKKSSTKGGFVYQVHPSRADGRTRAYDSAASGAKGTAVSVPDQYGSFINDKGITRGVSTLPATPLSQELPEGQFVVNITANASPTLFNAVADSAHSLHLQDLWVTNWQVSSDLQDPDIASTPLGPLVLEVKGDTISAFTHVFSNIGPYGYRVYL